MASSLFNIKFHFGRATFLDELERLLADGGRDFFRSKWLRMSLNAQTKGLEREIRKNAPKQKGRYLSKNIRAFARYSKSAPYGTIVIAPRTKGAAQYWLQREARPGLDVGGSRYRATIPSGGKKTWMYMPFKGTRLFRMGQGYDMRGVGEGATSMAKRAGFPITTLVKSSDDQGIVWGYKTKKHRSKKKAKAIFFAKRKVSGGSPYPQGRYIGPAILTREESIRNSIMWAWRNYQSQKMRSGRGKR